MKRNETKTELAPQAWHQTTRIHSLSGNGRVTGWTDRHRLLLCDRCMHLLKERVAYKVFVIQRHDRSELTAIY